MWPSPPQGDERSVLDTVLACDFERDALLEEAVISRG
eukprot:COSAG01_NODE_2260_length_8057_cov_50.825527_1_plen_37_part_00